MKNKAFVYFLCALVLISLGAVTATYFTYSALSSTSDANTVRHSSTDDTAPVHEHSAHASDSLRSVMQQMLVSMVGLQAALDQEDFERAAVYAQNISRGCDAEDFSDADPALYGPNFDELDRELHFGAAELTTIIEKHDISAARTTYNELVGYCITCHAQAPKAQHVELGRIANPYDYFVREK